jgi:LmbE family N-acetylglucosaminyl deacetylase
VTTSPTLWTFAHPDDETLGAGGSIAEHLAAGQDVDVLLLTRGTNSSVLAMLNGIVTSSWWGVPHDPEIEGYQPLSPAMLGEARIAEATAAMRCLAAGYPGTLTIHEGGLVDGQVTQAAAQAAIEAVCDLIAPGGGQVRLKAHSYVVDNNADHLAIGQAVRSMAAADPTRYPGARYYVLPDYWQDARLSLVAESWDLPTDAGVSRRVINAVRSYGAWAPDAGRFAVGWHSVPGMLGTLQAAPKCMQHA